MKQTWLFSDWHNAECVEFPRMLRGSSDAMFIREQGLHIAQPMILEFAMAFFDFPAAFVQRVLNAAGGLNMAREIAAISSSAQQCLFQTHHRSSVRDRAKNLRNEECVISGERHFVI